MASHTQRKPHLGVLGHAQRCDQRSVRLVITLANVPDPKGLVTLSMHDDAVPLQANRRAVVCAPPLRRWAVARRRRGVRCRSGRSPWRVTLCQHPGRAGVLHQLKERSTRGVAAAPILEQHAATTFNGPAHQPGWQHSAPAQAALVPGRAGPSQAPVRLLPTYQPCEGVHTVSPLWGGLLGPARGLWPGAWPGSAARGQGDAPVDDATG